MNQYQKIQTVFLRDPETNYKTLLEGQWAKPEFGLLNDIKWRWTEKVDGTNIRIMYNGNVRFGGKTDNSQIPTFLLNELQDMFPVEKMREKFGENEVCLYGEGYGQRIQKGGGNYLSGNSFILFDVKIGVWLEWESVLDIGQSLGIDVVPVVGEGSLLEAVEFARSGYNSVISEKEHKAEGLIMKPCVELFNRKGERILSKIKYKDFGGI